MTGWGQDGPLAQAAGHDLNYIAITGALYGLGQDKSRPHFPTNLVGDFGGGSTYLVIGILAALLEARVSGAGTGRRRRDRRRHRAPQRDGRGLPRGRRASSEERAANLLDGGAPFYDVYETADGRHISRRRARAAVLRRRWSSCSASRTPRRTATTSTGYDELRALIADTFRSRTQAEWVEVFDGTDACVAPVLPMTEAMEHPHLGARGTFVEHGGLLQPAPAPRFSRTAPRRSTARRPPSPAPTPAPRWPPGASPTSTPWSPAAPPSRPDRGQW